MVTGGLAFAAQADALEQEERKTKIVILGTGWGATSFLNALKPKHEAKYDIQVVSPRNYFLFRCFGPLMHPCTV